MVNNDVSFILSFVILMVKMWIFGFSPGVCPTEPSNLVFFFGCLVSNGRRALLRDIRLGGSATGINVLGGVKKIACLSLRSLLILMVVCVIGSTVLWLHVLNLFDCLLG